LALAKTTMKLLSCPLQQGYAVLEQRRSSARAVLRLPVASGSSPGRPVRRSNNEIAVLSPATRTMPFWSNVTQRVLGAPWQSGSRSPGRTVRRSRNYGY
jgi:hypothetical protein